MASKKPTKPSAVTSQKKNKAYGTGAFSPKTVETLAAQAGWICTAPTCQALTIGAADANSILAAKVGEAAHIKGENGTVGGSKNSARWEDIPIDDIRSYDNGIWLCPSCHTMIDKDCGGVDADGQIIFSVERLKEWKRDHLKLIQDLMLAHRSPLGHLRSKTADGVLAQELVNKLASKGSMWREMEYEMPSYAVASIEQLRDYIAGLPIKVQHDALLKCKIENLLGFFIDYMNYTGTHAGWEPAQVQTLRGHVGVFLQCMERDYNCEVKGDIRKCLPKML